MYIRYGFLWLAAVLIFSAALPACAETENTPPEWLLKNGVCVVSKLKAKDYPDWLVCNQDHARLDGPGRSGLPYLG